MIHIGMLSRVMRSAGPSVVAVAMMVPVSLLMLYLWSATSWDPTHGARHPDAGFLARAIAFLVAWTLMTVAMMLPSAMPLLVSLERVERGRGRRRGLPAFAALAYLATWGMVGVAVWMTALAAETHLLPWASEELISWLAGGSVALAGVYGLSPLASSCLRACRSPFGFLARHWRGGSGARVQAMRIGAAYGVSCVGCCVPMVGVMFVVGMANLAIVIALGAVMAIMKTSAVGPRVAQVLSAALILAGFATGLGWIQLAHGHR